MIHPSGTRLIKCDVQTDVKGKWEDFIDGGNGCLYGIPSNARRVLQFHVEDKIVKEVGPDLGNRRYKYINGIKAANGIIYCMPCNAEYFLKIIPIKGQDAEVQILNGKQLPEGRWGNGFLAGNGSIFYLPLSSGRILILDPDDDDSISLFEGEFSGLYGVPLVVSKDGCII